MGFVHKRMYRLAAICIAAVFSLLGGTAEAAPAQPNIVLIMADDMGYSDLGCYGSEIATPNLDRLAGAGLRFSQFYNAGRCCPTRAALLTGQYSHQAGLGYMTADRGVPSYQGNLRDSCVTLAEVLRSAGYTTLMTGKWHVANRRDTWPNQRGFDRYYGTPTGGGVYFKENLLTTRRGTPFLLDGENVDIPDDWYVTDAFTDYAVQFVKEAAKQERPFFLYVAHIAPHFPLQAKRADIDKYRGRYDIGWDALRERRYQRLIEQGLIKPSWKLSDRSPDAPSWDSLTPEQRADMALRMAVYAAQVDCLDQNVGRLVDTLKETGRFDNTLILFLSDNGCSAEEIHSPGMPGRGVDEPGSYLSAGLPWANAANTPFRMYKFFAHEGGISTPLIVHWPAGIKQPGRIVHEPCHVIDVMPTFLSVAAASYPERSRGTDVLPPEGVSLTPAFDDKSIRRDVPLCWEHEENRAVRFGKWKLVAKRGNPWELFDLEADRTETNDLAAAHPEKVSELTGLYESWAKRVGVLPWDEVKQRN